MRNNKFNKMVISFLVALTMMIGCVGCKGKPDENGSMKSDDGRSYGGTIYVDEGNEAETAFFHVKVDEAYCYDTYQFEDGLYQADQGMAYVVLKLTIRNTYGKDLPMSITDFILDFEGNEEKNVVTGYGKTELKDEQYMDNLFTLKQGESISKYVMYTVKKKDAYTLKYTEFYEDQLEGDTFCIAVTPKKK
ncbi:MAG: DUF4352 domain-containing protein [Eubacteriales bacterium]|nr:DUF4352 domain-containing protein [Eubacteriales bacterium]